MSPARKPLFTKPAWASKSNSFADSSHTNDDFTGVKSDETSIFGQNDVYEDIVAQERERREKHAQKVKEREEKERLRAKGRVFNGTKKVGDAKRRRISEDDEYESEQSETAAAKDDDNASNSGTEDLTSSDDEAISKKPVLRSTSATQKHSDLVDGLESPNRRKTNKIRSKSKATTFSSDDDELIVTAERPSTQRKRQTIDSESEEEDAYLRELKRKAREEGSQKKLKTDDSQPTDANDKSQTPALDPRSPSVLSPGTTSANDYIRNRATSTPAPDDPEIQILIETIIVGGRKLVVNRRASQPLNKVREYWIQHCELPPAIASKVFFTWNGTRLYNSTTMRGIIELLKTTNPQKDGSDPSGGKIVIEAMTEEILQYRQEQQERRRAEAQKRANGQPTSDPENEPNPAGINNDDGQQQAAKAERSGPIIRLTCPGFENTNIRLRPHTTVSRIIAAFKKLRSIDPGQTCWLNYDGEKLEDDQTAEEIGFEDEDCVHVYLK